MEKYSMTCTCGDEMDVNASSREEAIAKMQIMMSPKAVAKHFANRHPGEAIPLQEQVEMMIAHSLYPARVAAL